MKSLLERQKYPDLRQYPGCPPQRPYDVTAHTLPLLLNVEADHVKTPFTADLEKVTDVGIAKGGVTGQGTHFAFGHRNSDLMASYRLMKAGIAVSWATEGFVSAGRSFPAGTLLIPSGARAKAAPVFESLGVKAEGVRFKPAPKMLTLKVPRVGLYQSYVASMDEGWTRYIFDKSLGLDYTTLHDSDIRGGSLRARFDTIILPDSTARQMVEGHPKGEMADEFAGGLGAEGVAALKAFAEAGGTLVAFNNATELRRLQQRDRASDPDGRAGEERPRGPWFAAGRGRQPRTRVRAVLLPGRHPRRKGRPRRILSLPVSTRARWCGSSSLRRSR